MMENTASIARRVPRSLRNEHLLFEHHKRVAMVREVADQSL